ncbi:MAG: helix-turn-helix domain-containing protein [Aestuariivirga sp.]
MSEKKTTSTTTRMEQAAAVKTIGARMRQARELCNLSQSAAARRLGYSNPSKLSKVEGATDTNSVPLWLIVRAASVYEVSIDFLFGVTDDWELGARMTQEREVSAWLWDAMEKTRLRDMAALKKLHDRLEAMGEAVALMLASTDDVGAALARFAELNPVFEDMKAGGRLVGAVERATDAAKNAKAKMTRFRVECNLAAAETNQLSLAL